MKIQQIQQNLEQAQQQEVHYQAQQAQLEVISRKAVNSLCLRL